MSRKETPVIIIDGISFITRRRRAPIVLYNCEIGSKYENELTHSVAKQVLKSLIYKRPVLVETKYRDVYGRAVANVKMEGVLINTIIRSVIKIFKGKRQTKT